MKRRFHVHYRWNGYDKTAQITLSDGELTCEEAFIPIVRRLNNDEFGLQTFIYSWSLIEVE
jgi:hypothetical protein